MEKVKEALALSLDFIKNGILIRMGEGGTKHQPDLETPLINAIYSALHELEQSTAVEPAQAVPVAWLRKNGFRFIGEIEPQDDSEIPLYTAPPAIDDETRSMVLELCSAVQEHVSVWTYPYGKQTLALAKQIREKLEEGE